MRIIALLFQSEVYSWLMGDPDAEADTAFAWMITAIVVAVLGAGLIFVFKGTRKSMATIAKNKIWTRGRTWLTILVGIFPIFFALFLIWYFDHDYFNSAQIIGLFKGTLLAWTIYLVLMVLGHLLSPWRRELI